MTLLEVLVVIVVVVIQMAVLFPKLFGVGRSKKPRLVNCINNLKQVGLAYRLWEGDNGDIFPMGISVTKGGSMEMVATGDVVQTFLVMSNELDMPKLLHCPDDFAITEARSFAGLAGSNISYFVGVDITNDMNPRMIVSGDDNFEIGGVPIKSGLLQLGSNNPVAWTVARHQQHTGNLGLADGSVQSVTTAGLRNCLQQTCLATNRLAIP